MEINTMVEGEAAPRGLEQMDKNVKLKFGLLVAAVVASFVSANAGLALEPNVFPGKGDRAVWNKACKVLNEGHAIAKSSEDAAIPKFQQAIAIYPYADCFFLDLGVSYERKKKPELGKAEAAYRKAAELDPRGWRNWKALADSKKSIESVAMLV